MKIAASILLFFIGWLFLFGIYTACPNVAGYEFCWQEGQTTKKGIAIVTGCATLVLIAFLRLVFNSLKH